MAAPIVSSGAMRMFAFYATPQQLKHLADLAQSTGQSRSSYLRAMLDLIPVIHEKTLSGALVFGVDVHTSSGSVWVSGSLFDRSIHYGENAQW